MSRNPDDPSLLGALAYRCVHYPLKQLRSRNPEFWLYLLLRHVRAGPFRGMRYVGESCNPRIAPFLIGLNEREIWPFVRQLVDSAPDVIVNVGAAEGYYAVGFAMRVPAARVIAFEGNRHGRILTRTMARRNGVAARVEVRGSCDPAALAASLAPARRPAVLMDVEGYEETLLDPATVPALARSTIIVELHEHQRPMADILRPRFEPTHVITEAWSRLPTTADLPENLWPATVFFSPARLVQLGNEERGRPMRWWLLTPSRLAPAAETAAPS